MGLHMGLENPSHRKSFDPLHDLGEPLLHFDFSKVANTFRFPRKPDTQPTCNDTISDETSTADIRISSGTQPDAGLWPDAGVILIGSEYISYSGFRIVSGVTSILYNITRGVNLSTAAGFSAGDNIILIAGEYQNIHNVSAALSSGDGTGLFDFSQWNSTTLKVASEGKNSDIFYTIPQDTSIRPSGCKDLQGNFGRGRPAILFDGANDRLPLNLPVVTTGLDFTIVAAFRMDGTVASDAILGGSNAGVNQIKINGNTVLFRFNATSTSNNFCQVRLNDTDRYQIGSRGNPVDKGGSNPSIVADENELMIIVSEQNADDSKQKVYVYDAANLVGEEMTNNSGTVIDGYPNDGASTGEGRFQINHIGALSNDAGDFQGSIALITIYDSALTDEQIALLQEYYDNTYKNLRHD